MDAKAPETPESARALAARAVQRELQGAYECALEGYTRATQLFLSFARTSHGASSSAADDHKRMASRLLSRAERIKAALHHPLGARVESRDVLEIGIQSVAQVLSLADIDDLAMRITESIDTWLGRNRARSGTVAGRIGHGVNSMRK